MIFSNFSVSYCLLIINDWIVMRKCFYKAQRIQGYKCKFRVHKKIIFKGRILSGFSIKLLMTVEWHAVIVNVQCTG